MRHALHSLRRTMARWGSFIFLLALAPAAPAIQIMGNSAPYLSVGTGVFNMVGAVDSFGHNHPRRLLM